MLIPLCVPLCRYTIDRRTDMDRVFNIYAGNGSVYTLRELDREENAWHNISVIATEFSECSRHWSCCLSEWKVHPVLSVLASTGVYCPARGALKYSKLSPHCRAFIWPGLYLKQVSMRQLLKFSTHIQRFSEGAWLFLPSYLNTNLTSSVLNLIYCPFPQLYFHKVMWHSPACCSELFF